MTTDTLAGVERRPFDTLGHADHGWLDARHHFSFASYYDPDRMGWGAIRVWNDDAIAALAGFPAHPHRDMEIVTVVRTGAITHRDSLGNEGRTEAGDVQAMSAGTGVRHAEYNMEDGETTLFQIWIEPRTPGGVPTWSAKPFPRNARCGRLVPLASGYDEDMLPDNGGALPIRADARVLGATLARAERVEHEVGPGRHAYLVPSTGRLLVDGVPVEARDGVAITGGRTVAIEALDDAEVVLVDAE